MPLTFYIVVLFLGFAVGRFGHIFGGHIKLLHHWIYGTVLLVSGIFLLKEALGVYLINFGLGVVVSDLKDMAEFKFIGPDDVEVKKFWGID